MFSAIKVRTFHPVFPFYTMLHHLVGLNPRKQKPRGIYMYLLLKMCDGWIDSRRCKEFISTTRRMLCEYTWKESYYCVISFKFSNVGSKNLVLRLIIYLALAIFLYMRGRSEERGCTRRLEKEKPLNFPLDAFQSSNSTLKEV